MFRYAVIVAAGLHPACSLAAKDSGPPLISWIIAAKQGNNDSVKHVMDAFKRADVEKEVLATTLREHQAAVDATKSSAREAAAAAGI
eukprot:scaffold5143_cov131-Skeletonema_menzelii.AAC.3